MRSGYRDLVRLRGVALVAFLVDLAGADRRRAEADAARGGEALEVDLAVPEAGWVCPLSPPLN
jgi:hypothetical protein